MKKNTYGSYVNQNNVPQTQPLRGSNQVKNDAGGYSFAVSPWALLDRFLILGTEGGTYYASQDKLTVQSSDNLHKLLAVDPIRVIDRIVEVSDKGLAAKNAPAIYALAYVARHGSPEARKHAMESLPKVARTSTDLFSFVSQYKNDLGGGFGSVVKRGIANWYTSKGLDSLGYQFVKYRQRDGWSHHDVMHLSHPKAADEKANALYRYAKALDGKGAAVEVSTLPNIVKAYESVKVAKNLKDVLGVLRDNPNLPREAIPTEFLNSPDVWEAMLPNMPATALIRNLGKLSSIGLTKPLSASSKAILEKLSNGEWLKKSRVHPISVLMAYLVYKSGRGVRGDLSWTTNQDVADALDKAFYTCFHNVVPTGKNYLIGVDVSGSMFGSQVNGAPFMHAAHVALAMALVTKNIEQNVHVMGFSHQFVDLKVSRKDTLWGLYKRINGMPFGSTDCSLPMEYAIKENMDVDAFMVITDNETYAGRRHPSVALQDYRKKSGKADAKLIVMGTSVNNFTIADPKDGGMLDVVGFSSDAPTVVNAFIAGNK